MSDRNKLVRGPIVRGQCPPGPHMQILTISITETGWVISFNEPMLLDIIEQFGANDTREKLLFMISDSFRGLVQ